MNSKKLKLSWQNFWFESEFLVSRLRIFRTVFFMLLAFDLWALHLPHASRYGAGNFNVPHMAFLQFFTPDPWVYGLLYLISGFFCFLLAFGFYRSWILICLCFLYNFIYFSSQLDSYQHHYLMGLILFYFIFFPKEVMDSKKRAKVKVKSFAAKLIYLQVCIVYFFTALTKTDPFWLNGWALNQIIQDGHLRDLLLNGSRVFGNNEIFLFSLSAWIIMLWQFFVSLAFIIPRLSVLACLSGPIFHILVELIGLQIGWFSYYMIGIYYILLIDDQYFIKISNCFTSIGKNLFIKIKSLPQKSIPPLAVVSMILTLFFGHRFLIFVENPPLYDFFRFWGGDLYRRGEILESSKKYELANFFQFEGEARLEKLSRIYLELGEVEKHKKTKTLLFERKKNN